MNLTTEFLTNVRRIGKLHERMLREICEEYGLSLTEATVVSFLHNNPGYDTAADIAELRMLSKGNVSQAVEGLIRKALVRRRQDEADRRRIHLSLTEQARPVTGEMDRIWEQFSGEIFEGLSPAEREQFISINRRMMENARKAMARREWK